MNYYTNHIYSLILTDRVKDNQGSGFAVQSYHEAEAQCITKSKYYFIKLGKPYELDESPSFFACGFSKSFLASRHPWGLATLSRLSFLSKEGERQFREKLLNSAFTLDQYFLKQLYWNITQHMVHPFKVCNLFLV